MPAYVIVDIEVKDPERYEVYRAKAPATIAQFGGRYLVRGGNPQTLEGDWHTNRIAMLEFESVEQAKRWWDSPEYRAIRGDRQESTNSRMIVVEGL